VKFTQSWIAVAGVLVLCSSVSAGPHHSFAAAFDATKPVVVTGIIAEIRLVNPHAQFVVDVTDTSGKVETWRFEGSTPSSLIRSGFKPGTLKVGDKVTVKGSHARDMTQNAGAAREIVSADGRSFIVGPAGEEGSGGY
jgi:hypothetical protein